MNIPRSGFRSLLLLIMLTGYMAPLMAILYFSGILHDLLLDENRLSGAVFLLLLAVVASIPALLLDSKMRRMRLESNNLNFSTNNNEILFNTKIGTWAVVLSGILSLICFYCLFEIIGSKLIIHEGEIASITLLAVGFAFASIRGFRHRKKNTLDRN